MVFVSPGASSLSQVVTMVKGRLVKLQLWDTAGQDSGPVAESRGSAAGVTWGGWETTPCQMHVSMEQIIYT